MAVKKLKFLGLDGQAVTIGNSGFDAIDRNDVNSTFLFEDSWMPRGRISVIAKTSTSPGQLFGIINLPPTDYIAYDQPWIPRQFATGTSNVLFFTNTEARIVSVMIEDNGRLLVRDQVSATAWQSPTGTVVVGQEYVLSAYVKRHPTDGHIRVVLYRPDGVTVVADSGLITGRVNGNLPINRIRSSIGNVGTTNTIPAEHQWGEPRWDTAATGILTAWVPHYPYYGWVNGQYQKVYVYGWHNGAYVKA